MSERVKGSPEWIKAEQAKVIAGEAPKDTRSTGCLALLGWFVGIPVGAFLLWLVIWALWPK